MIYLDSSALTKLLLDEPESDALAAWLANRRDLPRVSSEIARIEVIRVCGRANQRTLPDAQRLLSAIDLMPVSTGLLQHAAVVAAAQLRTLDALHLATALSISDGLHALVTYDRRLATAAVAEHLVVQAPA